MVYVSPLPVIARKGGCDGVGKEKLRSTAIEGRPVPSQDLDKRNSPRGPEPQVDLT